MIHKEINKHKPHIFFSYLRNASSHRVKALMKSINNTSFSPHTRHTVKIDHEWPSICDKR